MNNPKVVNPVNMDITVTEQLMIVRLTRNDKEDHLPESQQADHYNQWLDDLTAQFREKHSGIIKKAEEFLNGLRVSELSVGLKNTLLPVVMYWRHSRYGGDAYHHVTSELLDRIVATQFIPSVFMYEDGEMDVKTVLSGFEVANASTVVNVLENSKKNPVINITMCVEVVADLTSFYEMLGKEAQASKKPALAAAS